MCAFGLRPVERESRTVQFTNFKCGIPPSLDHSQRTANLRTLAASLKETLCPFAPLLHPVLLPSPRQPLIHVPVRDIPRRGDRALGARLRPASFAEQNALKARLCGRAREGFLTLHGPGLVPMWPEPTPFLVGARQTSGYSPLGEEIG